MDLPVLFSQTIIASFFSLSSARASRYFEILALSERGNLQGDHHVCVLGLD